MTSILLRSARVIDTHSPYHNQIMDLLIKDEQIVSIGEQLEVDDSTVVFDLDGACLSPGWVEMHSNFGDPGFEERENLISGAHAAMKGGFSTVCITPSTQPVIQSKSDVEYIYAKSLGTPVNLFPMGTLSRDRKGEELTEMYDMFCAGAVAFYDDKKPQRNPNLLKLALQYAKPHEMPVIDFPFEPLLATGGQMNEGHTGTFLGLKGIPNLSEDLIVARDIELAAYAEGHIHLASISTKGSVDRIRKAKSEGIHVTCDVNLYNLILTDDILKDYDSKYKVLPPLRSEEDRLALIEGVNDGTIDAIAVDHTPLDIELKKCEFEHAHFGMAYIEHAFGLYGAHLKDDISLDKWVECVTIGPRDAYSIGTIEIAEGNPAEFTIFDQSIEWNDSKSDLASIAYNQPFAETSLKGKVLGIFNKGQYFSS